MLELRAEGGRSMFSMQLDVRVQMLQRYYAMGCSRGQGAGEDPAGRRQARLGAAERLLRMTGTRALLRAENVSL